MSTNLIIAQTNDDVDLIHKFEMEKRARLDSDTPKLIEICLDLVI